jgi:hypothetical protein
MIKTKVLIPRAYVTFVGRSSQKIRKLNNLEVFGSDKIKGQKQVSQDQLRSSMPYPLVWCLCGKLILFFLSQC